MEENYNPTLYEAKRRHKRHEEGELLEANDHRLDKGLMLHDREVGYEVQRSELKKLVTIREVDRPGPRFTELKRTAPRTHVAIKE